jgi:hypothetical protein
MFRIAVMGALGRARTSTELSTGSALLSPRVSAWRSPDGRRVPSGWSLPAHDREPADRLWRYPIGHAIVGRLPNTPLTPNHVTIGHTLLGHRRRRRSSAPRGRPRCSPSRRADVRGRAPSSTASTGCSRGPSGTASPYGRAMDQLGDFLGFAALMLGSGWPSTRTMGFSGRWGSRSCTAASLALCTFCWDFYKRRFTSSCWRGATRSTTSTSSSSCEAQRTRWPHPLLGVVRANLQIRLLSPLGAPGAARARRRGRGPPDQVAATHPHPAAAAAARGMAARRPERCARR